MYISRTAEKDYYKDLMLIMIKKSKAYYDFTKAIAILYILVILENDS